MQNKQSRKPRLLVLHNRDMPVGGDRELWTPMDTPLSHDPCRTLLISFMGYSTEWLMFFSKLTGG